MMRVAILNCVVLFSLSAGTWAALVLEGPTLTMDPNGLTPLAGVVEMVTDEPVAVRLSITDGTDSWNFDARLETDVHYLPVLGMKPDRTYTVDVALVPGGSVGTLFATTPPLPADFPALVVNLSNPAAMEPGYTMLDCMRRANGDVRPSYSAIVDASGEVVWYSTLCYLAARLLPDGTFYYLGGNTKSVTRTDMLGNLVTTPLADPGTALHHDMLLTPHGTFLSLNASSIDVEEYPSSLADPNAPLLPATLRDESVVEFLPDGSLRREWRLSDLIDTKRVAFDSLNAAPEGLDWAHSNAVNYRASDDSIIVSIRHQDAVIKYSRETGNLQWILGPHENWAPEYQPFTLTPVGTPFRWQFHQHAPMWTNAGTLLLFDNGNHRASPFDGTQPLDNAATFSRGVEFQIDEVNMEVSQIWEYGENIAAPIFASFISDADIQETTGNRLVTYGGIAFVGGVSTVDLGLGTVHARLIETTDDIVPVPVFDMTVYDPAGGRIAMYRSERIPSLYPQELIQRPNGIANTLQLDRSGSDAVLNWFTAPIDTTHSAADYYMLYMSASANGNFAMFESTAALSVATEQSTGDLTHYLIAAGNLAGKSADEPLP